VRNCTGDSAEVREQLRVAQEEGLLIDLPRHDWPLRDSPARREPAVDCDQQALAIRAIFGAPQAEAALTPRA
jgi:hypothetical protein